MQFFEYSQRLPLLRGEEGYLELLNHIMHQGLEKTDRTGTGTRSIFGAQLHYDLSNNQIPIFTTKRVHIKSVIFELLWFIMGDTNTKFLKEHGVRIWDEWADEYGDLGPIYGRQWRSWPQYILRPHDNLGSQYDRFYIDQLAQVIDQIKTNPDSRRMIVSAWNVAEIGDMRLPPCHLLFQFYVHDGELSLQLYQRSADMFLGVPFNVASYALLTHMVAHVTGLKAKAFIHTLGDAHIYNNHIQQVHTQLERTERKSPTLHLNEEIKDIDDFAYEDIEIWNYDPYPAIKAEVSV